MPDHVSGQPLCARSAPICTHRAVTFPSSFHWEDARCVLDAHRPQLPRIRNLHGPVRASSFITLLTARLLFDTGLPHDPYSTILHGAGARRKLAHNVYRVNIDFAIATHSQCQHSLRTPCVRPAKSVVSGTTVPVRALYKLRAVAQQKSTVILLRIWVQQRNKNGSERYILCFAAPYMQGILCTVKQLAKVMQNAKFTKCSSTASMVRF